MTWVRWVRSLLIVVIVAEVAAITTGGPRWRAPFPPDGELLGFAADGATVYALDTGGGGRPRAITYAAVTGRVREIPMSSRNVPRGESYVFHLAPAVGRVLVWHRPGPRAWDADPADLHRRVYDLVTGEPVGPPVLWRPTAAPLGLSADGRWLAVHSRDDNGQHGIDVVTLPAGTRVARIASHDGDSEDEVAFGDGDRAAVLCHRSADGDDQPRYYVKLLTLPTGHAVGRCDLLGREGGRLVRLDGARATIESLDQATTDTLPIQTVDFAATPPQAVRWPLPPFDAETDWPTVGPGWVAIDRRLPPDRLLDWITARTGRPVFSGRELAVISDRGKLIGHARGLPPRQNYNWSAGTAVAPAGNCAVVAYDGWLTLFDLQPPSPWPRSALAGGVAFVAWAWLERRRSRRAA